MATYERNAENFEKLFSDFGENPDPDFNEADTRAKIIDQILIKSLGWPETGSSIRREEHVHQGYIDYTLQAIGNFLIIEAKKIGKSFKLPEILTFRSYVTVKNLIKKQLDISLMYDQVVRYAHERSIPFCVLTNGTQWLIFSGVRIDNIHIRKSKVIIFNGFEDIRSNFLDFWNLLSFDSVGTGSLGRQLIPENPPIEQSFLFNSEGYANIPYDRNILSLALTDLLPQYFGDLNPNPTQMDMLKECFVLDSPIDEMLMDLDLKSGSEKPSGSLTARAPILNYNSLPKVSEKLGALIASFISEKRNSYFQVLLGRVGIGKTTFLSYFFYILKNELLSNHFTLYLDHRDISDDDNLNDYFYDHLWDMLENHPKFPELVSEEALREIYERDIGILKNGPLKRLFESQPERYEDEIALFLGKKYSDRNNFLKKLTKFIATQYKQRFIIIFDNVDQLDLELQEKVIRYAYSKTTEFNSFTILSMWEETYYDSKKGSRVLSTIRTVPLQITRQSITSVLTKRLKYLIKQIHDGSEPLNLLDLNVCTKDVFCQFIDLILRSLVVENKRVKMFLEGVAIGNIRKALETFSAFLTAGSLETPKILNVMINNDDYLVPHHEFIKSIMLGSKRFYSERTSDVVNLFTIGDMERPSHFTRLRLLQFLYERRHEASPFGTGYMHINDVVKYFNQIGVSNKDLLSSIRRLIESSIIEDDLRSQKYTESAQGMRITATGRYYLSHLFKMFSYIDLVMQDTPLFDHTKFMKIEKLCDSIDMKDRFERCELFIDYLLDQEEEELMTIEKLGKEITWRTSFISNLKSSFNRTKGFIQYRNH